MIYHLSVLFIEQIWVVCQKTKVRCTDKLKFLLVRKGDNVLGLEIKAEFKLTGHEHSIRVL